MNRYHEVLRDMYQEYGPVVKERFGTSTVLHLFEPELAKQVHQQDGKYPVLPPLQEALLLFRRQQNMSLGLGNTNGSTWYRLRSSVQQLLMQPRKVTCYLPLVDAVSRALVDRISADADADGDLPHLTDLVHKWSAEWAIYLTTERRLGALSGGESEALAERLIGANRQVLQLGAQLKFSLLPLYRYISTPTWRRLFAAGCNLTSVTIELFENAISDIEKLVENGQLQDHQYQFFRYLLSQPSMSRADVLNIGCSMFSDSLSTTVPTLLSAIWCLAHTPEAQRKLHEEIDSALPGSEDQSVTVDVINQLPYVKAVLKETLRLYPIGTEISRILNRDMELGGYHVPAGTHVDLNQWVQLRSADHFTEPDTFRPERWLRSQRSDINPYLHIPFGHGTRMCVGRRFAEQGLYVTLVRLLKRFKLLPTGGSYKPLRQVYNTLLMPDPPVCVRFVPR